MLMNIERVNIGLSIEQKLNELGMSKSEFGRKIGVPQQNVNRILDKTSIDTDKLATKNTRMIYLIRRWRFRWQEIIIKSMGTGRITTSTVM